MEMAALSSQRYLNNSQGRRLSIVNKPSQTNEATGRHKKVYSQNIGYSET